MSIVKVGDDEFEFDFTNPSVKDGRMIEKVYGETYKKWGQDVRDGSMTALTCLVYILKKKSGWTGQFDDIDFGLNDLEIIDPDAEPGEGEEANPTEPTDSTPSEADA